ncbi:MAG: hypothetical protein GF355_02575 [Candidatus Eisenbacteria bacterium]|nr:hypothetical protein [Candidatus Eisenbacteria bacterium]
MALTEERRRESLGKLAGAQGEGELRIVGEALPFEREVPEPPEEQIFLATQQEGVSLVYFPHAAHTDDYGIECAACHHMERCEHCHHEVMAAVEVSDLRSALMDNCIRCHDSLDLPTACDACHRDPHEM